MDAGTSKTGPESIPQPFQRVRPLPVPSRNVQCREVATKVLLRTLDDGVPRKGIVMESRGRSGLGHKEHFKHVTQVHMKLLWGSREMYSLSPKWRCSRGGWRERSLRRDWIPPFASSTNIIYIFLRIGDVEGHPYGESLPCPGV